MIKRNGLLSFILFVSLVFQAQSQSANVTQRISEKIQAYIDSLQKANGFPGTSVTVILPSREPISFAAGVSNKETGAAMKPGSLMLSGSTGKMYFAILTMLLVQDGKLSLDDKVEKYLGKNGWYKRVPNASQITIQQLLNHTTGIEEYYELGDFIERLKKEVEKEWKPEELIAYVFDRKPLFVAGNGFGYADTNYLILGMVLEELLGIKAYDEINRRIISPLGLASTQPSIKRQIKGLITGYSWPELPTKIDGAVVKNGNLVINPQFEWGGGGFASNTIDLATLVSTLMHYRPVKKNLVEEMKQAVDAPALGQGQQYGLGLQIMPTKWGKSYGHSGWFPGYMSDVQYVPEIDVTVAIQFNTDDFRLTKGHPRKYVHKIFDLVMEELKNNTDN